MDPFKMENKEICFICLKLFSSEEKKGKKNRKKYDKKQHSLQRFYSYIKAHHPEVYHTLFEDIIHTVPEREQLTQCKKCKKLVQQFNETRNERQLNESSSKIIDVMIQARNEKGGLHMWSGIMPMEDIKNMEKGLAFMKFRDENKVTLALPQIIGGFPDSGELASSQSMTGSKLEPSSDSKGTENGKSDVETELSPPVTGTVANIEISPEHLCPHCSQSYMGSDSQEKLRNQIALFHLEHFFPNKRKDNLSNENFQTLVNHVLETFIRSECQLCDETNTKIRKFCDVKLHLIEAHHDILHEKLMEIQNDPKLLMKIVNTSSSFDTANNIESTSVDCDLQSEDEVPKEAPVSLWDLYTSIIHLIENEKFADAQILATEHASRFESSKNFVTRSRFLHLFGLIYFMQKNYLKACEMYERALEVEFFKENSECAFVYESLVTSLENLGNFMKVLKVKMEYKSVLKRLCCLPQHFIKLMEENIVHYKYMMTDSIYRKSVQFWDLMELKDLQQNETVACDAIHLLMWFKADPISKVMRNAVSGKDKIIVGDIYEGVVSYHLEHVKTFVENSVRMLAKEGGSNADKIRSMYDYCSKLLEETSPGITHLLAAFFQGTVLIAFGKLKLALESLVYADKLADSMIKPKFKLIKEIKKGIQVRIRIIQVLQNYGKKDRLCDWINYLSNLLYPIDIHRPDFVDFMEVVVLLVRSREELPEAFRICENCFGEPVMGLHDYPLCHVLWLGLAGTKSPRWVGDKAYHHLNHLKNIDHFTSMEELYWLISALFGTHDSSKIPLIGKTIKRLEQFDFEGTLMALDVLTLTSCYFAKLRQEEEIVKLRIYAENESKMINEKISNYYRQRQKKEQALLLNYLNIMAMNAMKESRYEEAANLLEGALQDIEKYSPFSVQLSLERTVLLWIQCLEHMYP